MRKNNKGFTLIELIVVIAIIGILVAIAVPKLTNSFDAAYHATLETNMKHVETCVLLHMIELDDDKIYEFKDFDDSQNREYLSGILEKYLEDKGEPGNEDNSNYDAYKNPVSGKSGIINYRNIQNLPALGGVTDFYYQEAIYLTNDSDFKYVENPSDTKKTELLKYVGGSIVVYFSGTDIQIFYVDQDGNTSDHVTTY